jgi:hypothetical protein
LPLVLVLLVLLALLLVRPLRVDVAIGRRCSVAAAGLLLLLLLPVRDCGVKCEGSDGLADSGRRGVVVIPLID